MGEIMKKLSFPSLSIVLILLCDVQAQINKVKTGHCIRVSGINYFYIPVTGQFQKINRDSLFFTIQNKQFVIPVDQVQKVELLTGKKSNVITGGIIGAVSGGLILGIIADSAEKDSEGFASVGQPGFPGGFLAGALAGGGIGALIGYSIESEKWEEIKLSNSND